MEKGALKGRRGVTGKCLSSETVVDEVFLGTVSLKNKLKFLKLLRSVSSQELTALRSLIYWATFSDSYINRWKTLIVSCKNTYIKERPY